MVCSGLLLLLDLLLDLLLPVVVYLPLPLLLLVGDLRLSLEHQLATHRKIFLCYITLLAWLHPWLHQMSLFQLERSYESHQISQQSCGYLGSHPIPFGNKII